MSAKPLFLPAMAALAFAAATGAAHAADPACKPVTDAMVKAAGTPNHLRMHKTAAYKSAPSDGETITTANARYVKAAGSWHQRPYDPKQEMADMAQGFLTVKLSCKYLRDESVAGEDAALYDTVNTQEGGVTVDTRVWISKSRGLPIKQTMDMDVGGKQGKSHTEGTLDYVNVQPPAGVK